MTSLPETRTTEQSSATDIRAYLRIVRAFWRGAAAIIVASLLVALAWNATQTPIYASQATALVKVNTDDSSVNSSYTGEMLAKLRAQSYAELAMNDSVAVEAAKRLGNHQSPGALLGSMKVALMTDTAILQFTATGSSPQAAQKLASTWVAVLADRVKQIDGGPDGSSGVVTIEPLSSATLPGSPTSPNIRISLLVGFIVGLVLAIVYVLLRRVFDRRIRSVAALEQAFDVSVVGAIPDDPKFSDQKRMLKEATGEGVNSEDFAISESMRELRTNLTYLDVDNPPRVLVVTSAMPGEGKSSVAANLAAAISSSGQNVVLIDCDLRRPTQDKVWGYSRGGGLTDVLSGHAQLADVLQSPGESENFRLLTSGRIPPNPSELLGSKTMRELIRSLSEVAIVILDAPPLLPVTDAAVLAKSAEGVVVVARAKRTTFDQFGRALKALVRTGSSVTGVVVNRVPIKAGEGSAYGYYGSYYYGASSSVEQGNRRAMTAGKSKSKAKSAPGRRRAAE